jgi:methylmalonyl-CoA mutase
MGHLNAKQRHRPQYDSRMSAQPEPLALAAEFESATREQWRELVSAVLRKAGIEPDGDPEAALSCRTYEGIEIKPLYTAEDALSLAHDGVPGHPPFVRGATAAGAAGTGWDVRQRHADPDAAATNRAVLADLANGATSVWLVLGDAGLAVADLARALDGVYLDLAPIVLDAGDATYPAATALLSLASDRGVNARELRGSLGADPIGLRARSGAAADLALLSTLAHEVSGSPELCVATVDATAYHDAGASDADEIGVAAAVGVEYLRALTDGGVSIDAALAALEFRYAVTADQFLSIAKLRAARRVWDRVAELSGAALERRGQRQHAVTSAAMLSRRDPWVNLLRATVGCFAAAVAGAESITVLPFDSAVGLPDDLGRRMARNTQSILHDESSLARVIDAAGGSWYVETLTDQLAEKAWATFVEVERAGGALTALDDGTLEQIIAPARERRAADIAHRRAPLTGVSEFADVAEAPVMREPAPIAVQSGPLPARRWAEPFEQLRDRADAVPGRPKVFLAAIGPVASYTARVGFASNLFQAAGIVPVVGSGTPDDMVDEFIASGTPVVCLCSSDRVYEETAGWVAKALREAGAEFVWLAGRPGDREDADRASGIDGYLYGGCDALHVLRTTLDQLGVT